MVETALRHASIGIRCEPVWSATFLRRSSTTDTSMESSRLAEFECEISPGYEVRQKKWWLLIIPAWRQWPATTRKKVWTTTYLRHNWTSRTSLESSQSRKLKYAVSAGLVKRLKNYSSLNFLQENLEKFRLTELYDAPLEGSKKRATRAKDRYHS